MRVAMERTNVTTLMLYVALALALRGYAGGAPLQQPTPRLMPMPFPMPMPLPPQPLCASQFALVNHACSTIMPAPVPPPTPPSPPGPPPLPPCHDDESQDGNEYNHHHHHHRHHHHHHHCHKHGHHHRHRHGGQGGNPTPAEQDCCKWLKEVDSECVCDLMVHLPTFLARPIHEYTVIVADSCSVTYSCGGRLLP